MADILFDVIDQNSSEIVKKPVILNIVGFLDLILLANQMREAKRFKYTLLSELSLDFEGWFPEFLSSWRPKSRKQSTTTTNGRKNKWIDEKMLFFFVLFHVYMVCSFSCFWATTEDKLTVPRPETLRHSGDNTCPSITLRNVQAGNCHSWVSTQHILNPIKCSWINEIQRSARNHLIDVR